MGMLTGAIAKEQIHDRIEAARADRTARAVGRREGLGRSVTRATGSGVAALLRATRRRGPQAGTSPTTSTA
jgi:hypothetical protein